MIGAAIGAALGVGSSIFGGMKAKAAAKKYKDELAKQRQKNEAWYNRRYNEDATQTAEAQSMLRAARDSARAAMDAARGRQAVMGGTEESVAATRSAANKRLGDTMSNIAAQGTARKDAIESQYMQRDNAISKQYMDMYAQQAKNATDAAGEGTRAGMGMVGADAQAKLQGSEGLFEGLFKKKK